MKTKWYKIDELYDFTNLRLTHKKKGLFLRLSCVYKIKIDDKLVHVGRSDTCRKHGGAEKVRKALVQMLHLHDSNPSVIKTKYWETVRQEYHATPMNIQIGIIETDDIEKVYTKEHKKID